MNCYRSIAFYCIVISYILCQFSVTSRKHHARTTVTPRTTTTKSAGKYSSTTEGTRITVKTGANDTSDEERYACSPYFQCVDIFQPGWTYYGCVDIGVRCCKIENFVQKKWPPITRSRFTGCQCYSSLLHFLVFHLNPSLDPGNAANLNPIEPTPSTPAANPSIDEDCQCVPVDQCRRSNETEFGKMGDSHEWYSRTYTTRCWIAGETCCPKQNIVTSTPTGSTGKPTSTSTVTVTPSDSDPTCCTEQNVVTPTPTGPTKKLTSTSTTVIPSDSDFVPDCGMRNKAKGLNSTSSGEFPWTALLLIAKNDIVGQQRLDDIKCGASLISLKVLLTAGHCVHDVSNVSSLKVRVGEFDTRPQTNQKRNHHQDRQVSKITLHPDFDSKTLHNDLALIEVTEPFEFGYDVHSVCIPLTLSTYDYDPNNCVYTGWSKNAFGSLNSHSTALKKVDLKILANDRCQEELRKTRSDQNFTLHSSFMCAGGRPGKDTCANGGGGPLACPLRDNPDRYVQVGIVSSGFVCGNGTPVVFASLERNLDWFTDEYYACTIFD